MRTDHSTSPSASVRLSRIAVFSVILLFAWPSFASADGACPIKNGPSKELEEYLRGVQTLTSAIRSRASWAQCQGYTGTPGGGGSADVEAGSERAMGAVNRMLTSENLFTSFRFTVDLIRRTELPPAIRRDHSVLAAKQKAISGMFNPIFWNCGNELEFEENVSPFPEFDTQGKKVGDVLEALLQNHADVMAVYREAVIGNPPTVDHLPIVPGGRDAFVSAIQGAYGPAAVEVCNTTDSEGFYKKVTEAIDRIGNMGGEIQRGTKDWQDAWKLLQGKEKDYARRERDLLKKELSRQGLSSKKSERALRNLDDYNQGKGWQGIHSSLMSVGDTVARGVHIAQALYVDAKKALAESENTDQYVERVQNVEALKTDLGKELVQEKERLLAVIGEENLSADENLGQLMEMHALLSKTIKALEPAERACQKTCMDQAKNEGGNCRGE